MKYSDMVLAGFKKVKGNVLMYAYFKGDPKKPDSACIRSMACLGFLGTADLPRLGNKFYDIEEDTMTKIFKVIGNHSGKTNEICMPSAGIMVEQLNNHELRPLDFVGMLQSEGL